MVLRNQKKGHIARGQRASGPRLVTLDHTGPLRCPKTQDLSLHHGRLQVSDDRNYPASYFFLKGLSLKIKS